MISLFWGMGSCIPLGQAAQPHSSHPAIPGSVEAWSQGVTPCPVFIPQLRTSVTKQLKMSQLMTTWNENPSTDGIKMCVCLLRWTVQLALINYLQHKIQGICRLIGLDRDEQSARLPERERETERERQKQFWQQNLRQMLSLQTTHTAILEIRRHNTEHHFHKSIRGITKYSTFPEESKPHHHDPPKIHVQK